MTVKANKESCLVITHKFGKSKSYIYTVENIDTGKVKEFTADTLKRLIREGSITVANATLTSDNRLVTTYGRALDELINYRGSDDNKYKYRTHGSIRGDYDVNSENSMFMELMKEAALTRDFKLGKFNKNENTFILKANVGKDICETGIVSILCKYECNENNSLVICKYIGYIMPLAVKIGTKIYDVKFNEANEYANNNLLAYDEIIKKYGIGVYPPGMIRVSTALMEIFNTAMRSIRQNSKA